MTSFLDNFLDNPKVYLKNKKFFWINYLLFRIFNIINIINNQKEIP